MISINIIIFVIICFAKFTNPIPDVLDIRRISAFRIAGSGGSSSSSCFWRGGLVGCGRAVAAADGPNIEGLIPIHLLSYRFGLAGLEYLNHKCVCFLP